MSSERPTVYLDNGWTFVADLTKMSTATARETPAAGEVGYNGYFSLTKNGVALGGTTVALAEAAGALGSFTGVLGQASVATALAGLSTVWEVTEKAGSGRQARLCNVLATRVTT